MALCFDCKQQLTPENQGWPDRCVACVRRRYSQKLLEVYMMTSEGPILTSSGWNNAGMVDGEPVVWLCEHDHSSRQEAADCLRALQAHGGRDWRFRVEG